MTYWLITGAVLYVAWLLFLYFMQERLMFPGLYLRHDGDSAPRPPDAEVIWLDRPDGARVEAWLLPARQRPAGRELTAEPAPLVVAAHGNAELIDDHAWFLDPYRDMGCGLLLVEYRGFARSTGLPGEEAEVGDFLAAIDVALAHPGVDARRLVYHGRSIGGGVLVQVAAHRPPAALILESSFTSMASFAGRYLAPPLLVRHPFRTDRVLPGLKMPMLIMHGSGDHIIPVSHGRRLHELAPHATYVEYPAGHNDFPPDEDAYWAEIEKFLRSAEIVH